jgi:hypothetical protein
VTRTMLSGLAVAAMLSTAAAHLASGQQPRHTAGTQAAMPDGSVRYVRSEKDPQARKALKPRGRSRSIGFNYGKMIWDDKKDKKRRPSGRAVAPSH